MNDRPGHNSVNEELFGEIVRRVLSVGQPEKIVLFGSHARGTAGVHSDLDLLIVEHSTIPRYSRATRYYAALAHIAAEKDIVVWTPEEIEDWSRVENAFPTTAIREGKVLYAR